MRFGTVSKRWFKITTIHNYGNEENERREISYDTARTAREMLKRRGVHLNADEKARQNHLYASETESVWIAYWRVSRDEAENK
jgi:hypothetical protein